MIIEHIDSEFVSSIEYDIKYLSEVNKELYSEKSNLILQQQNIISNLKQIKKISSSEFDSNFEKVNEIRYMVESYKEATKLKHMINTGQELSDTELMQDEEYKSMLSELSILEIQLPNKSDIVEYSDISRKELISKLKECQLQIKILKNQIKNNDRKISRLLTDCKIVECTNSDRDYYFLCVKMSYYSLRRKVNNYRYEWYIYNTTLSSLAKMVPDHDKSVTSVDLVSNKHQLIKKCFEEYISSQNNLPINYNQK